MRALAVSYGDISIFTRSPIVSRMKRLRIFPEMCARTMRSFASATRNIVPGSTIMMVPSNTIAFSEFTVLIRRKTPALMRMSAGGLIQSTCESRRNFASRLEDADGPRADVLH